MKGSILYCFFCFEFPKGASVCESCYVPFGIFD